MKNNKFRKVCMLPSLFKFIFVFICTISLHLSNCQILTDYPCYSISENNSAPNVLFEYDPETKLWNRIGITGGNFIEALATDPLSGIIYATDQGQFGTVDPQTGQFIAIGSPGTANGEFGLKVLNDIDGLTFDLNNQIMYASHRVGGLGPQTNDLLFQIDVATGKAILGAMLDSNGSTADYAVVEEVLENTSEGAVYDVDDIAINPYTGKLYAIQNQDGPSTITQINPLTGKLIEVVFDVESDDVEGLGFTYLGELYATTGSRGVCNPTDPFDASCYNTFVYIDLVNSTTEILNFIDPTGVERDFESFDCFTAFNDLALVNRLDQNTPQPVNPGDQIKFNITVYNQGSFDNENIKITNYIPDGLTLDDSNWSNNSNSKTSYIYENTLAKGADFTVPITFKVDADFTGTSLKSTAEISGSFSPNVSNTASALNRGKKLLPMPDVDSTPDELNNEVNVVDNEIYQSGPNANTPEDEDDHDIEIVNVGNSCVNSLDFQSEFLNGGVYQAGEYITCQSHIIGPSIQLSAGKSVTLNTGFYVTKITSLSAVIDGCN